MDLPAAVTSALRNCGVEVDEVIDDCTACHREHFFSHRARREHERHVMVLWRDPPDGPGPERPPAEREAGPERPPAEREAGPERPPAEREAGSR